MRSRLIGKQHKAAGAEVEVVAVKDSLVMRCEIIEHRATRVHLHETVAEVQAACVGVEGSVSGDKVDIPGGIGYQPAATVPDPAAFPIARRAVSKDLP